MSRKRIIVADDMENVTNSVKQMLEPYYDVTIAHSGTEVLAHLRKGSYDGVILDVRFDNGGMSGLDTAEIVRRFDREIRIVIFSAQNYSNDEISSAVSLGASFMEKPIELEQIRKVLDC